MLFGFLHTFLPSGFLFKNILTFTVSTIAADIDGEKHILVVFIPKVPSVQRHTSSLLRYKNSTTHSIVIEDATVYSASWVVFSHSEGKLALASSLVLHV